MQQARQWSTYDRPHSPAEPAKSPSVSVRPRRLKKAKLLFIVTTCFLLSLVVVAQYSSLVVLNYRLSAVWTDLADARKDTYLLETDVARLSSINRIEKLARTELGMVDPELNQLIVLSPQHE